jgi:hypothetical protein
MMPAVLRPFASLLIAGALGVTAHPFKEQALLTRDEWPRYEEYVALPPAAAAPLLAMGYRELWADITWARTLVYYGSSHIGDSQFLYLDKFIDNVLALDPTFYRVYRWAAYAVTYKDQRATQAEYRASVRYLERGILAFPDQYELFWLLGIRYWLDLESDDPAERRRFRERAAHLIEQAMRKPDAPPDLATLATTMRTKLGQTERARRELLEMILTTENEAARERMLNRYGALVESTAEVDEIARAVRDLEAAWQAELPYAPASFYFLLGPPPSPAIDFGELATERDLFSLESGEP